jgi:diguanylate cyclase (GGDEF)-like protein
MTAEVAPAIERPRFTTAMLDQLADAAFAIDETGCIVCWNYAAAQLLGWRPQVAEGSSCAALLEAVSTDGVPCHAGCAETACVLGPSRAAHPNMVVRAIDGTTMEVTVVKMAVILDGRPALLLLLRRPDDLTHDDLTGLVGRHGLEAQFRVLQSLAQRSKTPLCVALVDVDHLKRINDLYGHTDGDRAILAVAGALLDGRRHELVGRWGGDEFVVLLPGCTPEEALTRCVRTQEVLGRAAVRDLGISVTMSGGIAQAGHDEDLAAAVDRADAALRRSKRRRGRFLVTRPADGDASVVGRANRGPLIVR